MDGHFQVRNHFAPRYLEIPIIISWILMTNDEFHAESEKILQQVARNDASVAERLRVYEHLLDLGLSKYYFPNIERDPEVDLSPSRNGQ